MKYKRLLACFCIFGLVGCGTTTTESNKALFEGMDGKKTYGEVVKKMNDEVNYFQSMTDDTHSVITSETYKIKNQLCIVSKSVFEEGALNTLSYTITQDTDFHTLFLGADDQYKYELITDYPNVIENIYTDYLTNKNYKVYDIEREDSNNQITLKIKLQASEITGGGQEYTETRYAIDEMIINKNGYVSQEKLTYYTDDQFSTETNEVKTIKNSDFNKKSENDFNNEIELMKSCDGLNDKEVKEKLGLNKE